MGLAVLQLIEWLSRGAKKVTWQPVVAIFIGLLAPALMGSQGFDDHDRSDDEQLQLTLRRIILNHLKKMLSSSSAIMIPILCGMLKRSRECEDLMYGLST